MIQELLKKVLKIVLFFNFIFLLYNYAFNNRVIESSISIKKFIKKNFGLNLIFIKILENRLEKFSTHLINQLSGQEIKQFLLMLYKTVPHKASVYSRFCLNIYLLDLATCYKGWRHYKGLPANGQRTWSNGWTAYKSNNILRNFKLKSAKKYYINVPMKEGSVAYTAEYVNLLWRLQWPIEWYSARNHRLKYSGHPGTMKIDLYSMCNYQVMHPAKLKKLTKKQKQAFKKNYFSLGFDIGFTRPLLNSIFNASKKEDLTVNELKSFKLVLRDERLNKKKKK